MKNFQTKLFLFSNILVLAFSLFNTVIVYADDGTPPPPVEDSVVTDAPVVTESEPISTDEVVNVQQMMHQLPEDTTIVVLDASGDSLPLATEQAANILVVGDPMWCPSGVLPGGNGCTSAHASFTALLNDLQTNNATYTGNGTIYIASNYDATVAGDAGNSFTFDGAANGGSTGLGNLVIQGGWNFVTNTITGTSTIDLGAQQHLTFYTIGGSTNYTLNNLIMQNTNLYVSSTNDNGMPSGNITLSNIAGGAGGTGIVGGNVTVNNSNFSNSNSDGLYIESTGTVTLNNVTASNNNGNGVNIMGSMDMNTMDTITPNVTVNGGTFNNNIFSGLYIDANHVSLNGVTSSGNADPDSISGSAFPAIGVQGTSSSSSPSSSSSSLITIQPVPITSLNDLLALLPEGTILPEGTNFVAGFSIEQLGEVTFALPDGITTETLVVLFFDGTDWVEVPATVVDSAVVFNATAPGVYIIGTMTTP